MSFLFCVSNLRSREKRSLGLCGTIYLKVEKKQFLDSCTKINIHG